MAVLSGHRHGWIIRPLRTKYALPPFICILNFLHVFMLVCVYVCSCMSKLHCSTFSQLPVVICTGLPFRLSFIALPIPQSIPLYNITATGLNSGWVASLSYHFSCPSLFSSSFAGPSVHPLDCAVIPPFLIFPCFSFFSSLSRLISLLFKQIYRDRQAYLFVKNRSVPQLAPPAFLLVSFLRHHHYS